MNPEAPTQFSPLPQIPDYRLIRRVDAGAFGEVWLAQSEATTRYRAVKIVMRDHLPSHRPYEIEFAGLKRFEEISREHEGFVDILHISRNDQAHYFYYVMELADDLTSGPQINEAAYVPRTLTRELAKRKRLPLAECVRIGLALTSALIELHRQSLVHRDIKPSNILFVRGAPKLGDIGLVTEARLEAATLIGTPAYMDPHSHGTPQGDLFSLGKVLYVMATGRNPSEWPDGPEDLSQIEDLEGFHDLEQIYRRACQEPAHRYRNADEIRQHLLVLQAGRSVRRLQKMERVEAALKRFGLPTLLLAGLMALALYQWDRQARHAAELTQRTVGSYVAYGTRAMEEQDWFGALPWFVEALRLDHKNPGHEANHRLRLGSILQRSPTLVQMGFHDSPHDNPYYFATFAGQENQFLDRCPDGHWAVFDLATKKQLTPGIGTGDAQELAAINPAVSLAVTANESLGVQLWNYQTGELIRTLRYATNTLGASLSPDGHWAAAWALDNTAVVWNTRTGETNQILRGDANKYVSIRFSPSGRWLVTTDDQGRTIVWDRDTGQPWRTLSSEGNSNLVFQATFSPDERRVATANLDHSARIFDLESSREILPPLWHDDGVLSVEFDASGQRFVTAALDYTARIWDTRTGRLLHLLRHHAKLAHAAFSPSGRYLITATHDGTTRIWDLRPAPPETEPQPQSVSRDGSRLAIIKGDKLQVLEAADRRLVSIVPWDPASAPQVFLNSHGDKLLVVSAVTNASSSNQLTAVLWDLANRPVEVRRLRWPADLSNVVFSATGKRLAAFGRAQLQAWDLPGNRLLLASTQAVQRAVFAPQDDRLAVAAANTVVVWRLDQSPPGAVHFPSHHTVVDSLGWNHDGRLLATGCWDNTFHPEAGQLWDAATGRAQGPPFQHLDGVRDVVFSPRGDKLITCSEDFTAILWEVQTGRKLAPPLRHQHQVVSAAFSPDKRWVATACRDGGARVWDAINGEPLTPPFPHSGALQAVQFVNQSRQLFTQTQSGQTRLWDLRPDPRPVEDLVHIAELLSAQQSRPTEMRAPQTKEALRRTWSILHTNYPGEFAVGPQ